MINDLFTQAFPILQFGNGYTLREQEVSDANAFFAYYSDPRVGKHILATKPKSLADACTEIYHCRHLFQHGKGIYWAIADKNNHMIGAIGIYINHQHSRGEICYDLAYNHWGQGIMTQAMQAVIHYCFHRIGLVRLEATTLADNAASVALLKKSDFHYEGTLKKYRYYSHKFYDVDIYALITPVEILQTNLKKQATDLPIN